MGMVLGFNEVLLSELFYNELPSIEVLVNNNIYNYGRLLIKHLMWKTN